MAFIKINRDSFEFVDLTLRPRVHFISSSVDGTIATGSVYVVPQRSKVIKEVIKPIAGLSGKTQTPYLLANQQGFDLGDYKIIELLKTAGDTIRAAKSQGIYSSDIHGFMNRYMQAVGDAPLPIKYNKVLDVFRFDAPWTYNKEQSIKNNIRKILMPHHQVRYNNSAFEYTNYNTLNFFTASFLPTGSCLIYPNHKKNDKANIYTPKGPFTLDFYINPRYTADLYKNTATPPVIKTREFNAGTIFHMSSTIALSLISGSSRDAEGKINGYRLLLQLSQSADIAPNKLTVNESLSYPNDLIFSSSDNSLKYNHWHHVCVRWGGTNKNNGTGSIEIDSLVNNFVVPSSSIATSGADAIFIGNFYDGPNVAGDTNIARFFNKNVEYDEGVTDWNDGAYTKDPNPSKYSLSNPLNAEVHDIKLYSIRVSNKKAQSLRFNAPKGYEKGLLFYVPPFFQKETRTRNVLVTPFQKIRSHTDDPFNVSFSFGVGGKLINLENFTREFVQGEFPRLLHLTASEIEQSVQNITADQYIYGEIPQSKLDAAGITYISGSALKRNLTILPNDNGIFAPNYFPLVSGTIKNELTPFKSKPNDAIDYTIISLENLVPTGSLYPGLIFQTGSIFDQIVGCSPENPGVAPGAVLTIAQRTRDVSSNEVVVFDISNLYYGNRILPNSFIIKDDNLTGSFGKIKMKFKDNGAGSLYRANCLTAQAKWSNCGNLFYDEGIAIIKTPHAFYFCKDRTDMKFRGQQNLHISTLNAFCPKSIFNSSSNPSYEPISASMNANDENAKFVYLTGINVHDDNLNVIMRANFAQPIVKRKEDGYLFKIKQDY